MASLIGLSYSPWTEKARWALDHHRVPYRFREYLPIFGVPMLRLRTGTWRGRVTVPVFIGDGRQVIKDSFEIARHADERREASRLFPLGAEEEIARWNAESEAALAAGRALVVPKIAASPGALADSLPKGIPGPLRNLLKPLARSGTRYFTKKYALAAASVDAHVATVDGVLGRLAAALAGRDYLLGAFCYADVTMAVVLQFIAPVEDRYIRLGAAERECWSEPSMANRHPELIAWRDRLYAKHRAK
jgi:glutathione S-transferase